LGNPSARKEQEVETTKKLEKLIKDMLMKNDTKGQSPSKFHEDTSNLMVA
jgi:hypothetical protein